jgi:hypothetical protein
LINNDKLIISKVSGKIELKENENKENKNIKNKKYYLKNINIDNNIDNNEKTTIIYKENKPINDNDIHNFNFLIRINNVGKYTLLYNFRFTIIHSDCPNESYTYEENGNIAIECILPFYFRTKLESSLYSDNLKDKTKIFYKNYPIKYNIFLTNNLNNKIIIKNINIENVSKTIRIYSPILKIFSNKEKNIFLSPEDKFILSNKIFINEDTEDQIGTLKITWISWELNENEQTKNIINETYYELNRIIAKDIFYKIEGRFIFENNCLNNYLYYQLKIKNLTKKSKKIRCELFEENNNDNNDIVNNNNDDTINQNEKFSFGKTIIKDIIMPKKELIFLFHFYINNSDNYNIKSIDYRCNNIIKIEECNIENQSNIMNKIVFIPELYSQLNTK